MLQGCEDFRPSYCAPYNDSSLPERSRRQSLTCYGACAEEEDTSHAAATLVYVDIKIRHRFLLPIEPAEKNGWSAELLSGPAGEPGDAHPHPGPGRGRQDHHPVPAAGRGGGDHHPHNWVQRGASYLQEPQVPGLGPRWPDEHKAVLAVLLLQHGRHHLCGGQCGSGPHRHLQGGAGLHARGGGAEKGGAGGAGQQAGPGGGHDGLRDPHGPGAGRPQEPHLPDLQDVRPQRQWPRRSHGVVIQCPDQQQVTAGLPEQEAATWAGLCGGTPRHLVGARVAPTEERGLVCPRRLLARTPLEVRWCGGARRHAASDFGGSMEDSGARGGERVGGPSLPLRRRSSFLVCAREPSEREKNDLYFRVVSERSAGSVGNIPPGCFWLVLYFFFFFC